MNILEHLDAIILAAGRGTRMKATEKNKVMYEIAGTPMISFPVRALQKLGVKKPIVVIGFVRESVQAYLKDDVRYAIQEKTEGTADAVRVAMPSLLTDATDVIVLYGDHSAFYTAEVLATLVEHHRESNAAMTLITTNVDSPTGYGRILRDLNGDMTGIVEEKNATDEEKKITEINTGNAIYKRDFLEQYLPKIERNAISGEFYFTDIVSLGFTHHEKIETFVVEDAAFGMGVNTPEQLQIAEEEMKRRGM
ncbi:MAG TPA: sugar phosphate nucleotidyltransferase [Patescibacteria group bacterium]|nr:sugar phosphate nucleotidyltransferase [Patescibacteria group bacterium]